jgi:hypothetical protein
MTLLETLRWPLSHRLLLRENPPKSIKVGGGLQGPRLIDSEQQSHDPRRCGDDSITLRHLP